MKVLLKFRGGILIIIVAKLLIVMIDGYMVIAECMNNELMN